jgi:hypothetical protein
MQRLLFSCYPFCFLVVWFLKSYHRDERRGRKAWRADAELPVLFEQDMMVEHPSQPFQKARHRSVH